MTTLTIMCFIQVTILYKMLSLETGDLTSVVHFYVQQKPLTTVHQCCETFLYSSILYNAYNFTTYLRLILILRKFGSWTHKTAHVGKVYCCYFSLFLVSIWKCWHNLQIVHDSTIFLFSCFIIHHVIILSTVSAVWSTDVMGKDHNIKQY